jgi:hypothetical protein
MGAMLSGAARASDGGDPERLAAILRDAPLVMRATARRAPSTPRTGS